MVCLYYTQFLLLHLRIIVMYNYCIIMRKLIDVMITFGGRNVLLIYDVLLNWSYSCVRLCISYFCIMVDHFLFIKSNVTNVEGDYNLTCEGPNIDNISDYYDYKGSRYTCCLNFFTNILNRTLSPLLHMCFFTSFLLLISLINYILFMFLN